MQRELSGVKLDSATMGRMCLSTRSKLLRAKNPALKRQRRLERQNEPSWRQGKVVDVVWTQFFQARALTSTFFDRPLGRSPRVKNGRFDIIHKTIKFTYGFSETELTFLDITLYKGERFGQTKILDVPTHIKPTNKQLYIRAFLHRARLN